jgi:hypothetical protein
MSVAKSHLIRALRQGWRFSRTIVQQFTKVALFQLAILRLNRTKYELNDLSDSRVLLLGGRGMGPVWGQIWAAVLLHLQVKMRHVVVIDTRKLTFFNIYLRLLGARIVTLGSIIERGELSAHDSANLLISGDTNEISLHDVRAIAFKGVPLGEFALSTYCRHHATGTPTFSNSARGEIQYWILQGARIISGLEKFLGQTRVDLGFATELFLEEYGPLAFTLVKHNKDLIRFAATTRDDAFLIERIDSKSIRRHHAAVADSLLDQINAIPMKQVQDSLASELRDRYSDKWYRAKRNLTSTSTLTRQQARAALNIDDRTVIAIIYSHILYDSLFFYGADLFDTYSEWLENTVQAALENTNVKWFIKVHPSNMWRGELETFLDGKFEEERIVEKLCSSLPSHVRIIRADDPWSPLTWMRLADVGITVRGTAGIEMAAEGKLVICAGRGRYENGKFCKLPNSRSEYIELLSKLHHNSQPLVHADELAQKYLFGLYCVRPYRIPGIRVDPSPFTVAVVKSEDLNYRPVNVKTESNRQSLKQFAEFLLDRRVEQLTEIGTDMKNFSQFLQ